MSSAWGGLVFAPHVDYATDFGNVSVASGDLDEDGDVDLAVTTSTGVSIFVNGGAGTFNVRQDRATGSFPRAAVIANLNGDTHLDLVLTNTTSNSISILLGDGTGSFQQLSDVATGLSPTSAAIADVDGDNKADLMVTTSGDNTMAIFLGDGTGGFTLHATYPTGSSPRSAATGDLNGDGKLDVIDVSAGPGANRISVFFGNGDGTFQPRVDFQTSVNPRSVAVADLNNDGALDLAIANLGDNSGTYDGLSVLLGNGDGTFRARQDYFAPPTPTFVAAGDLTGDGIPDVVLAVTGGIRVETYAGGVDGTFPNLGQWTTGEGPVSIAIADLNNDGRRDLAVVNPTDRTLAVLINIEDHPPTLDPITDLTVSENATADEVITGSDPEGQYLLFSLTAGPTYVAVNGISVTTGNIHVAPGYSDAGTAGATIRATDSGGSFVEGSLTITVINSDRAPTLAVIANQTVAEGATADVPVGATDADAEVITLSAALPQFATITSVPAAGSVSGSIHIAPNLGDAAGSPYGATVTASSGSPPLTSRGSFTITLTHVNRPPALTHPGDMAVNEGATADQALTASDPDGDVLNFSLASGPTFAAVATVTAATGAIHLAPGYTDGNGSPSTYTVTVRVADGSASDTESFAITVNNTNRAPTVSAPLSVSSFEGSSISFSITGSDPDADLVTLAVLNLPIGATFIDNGGGAGSFAWVPSSNQAGTYSVNFISRDSHGTVSPPSVVAILVNDLNRPPVANPGGPYTGVVNVPIVFDGSGSSDPDGSALTYSWDFGDATTGNGPTPQHSYGLGGTATIVLTVSDGLLSNSATSTATIQDTFPARAFTTNGFGTIRLGSGKSTWCVQIEPVNGSYLIPAVLASSITMVYGAEQIHATGGKSGLGSDKDGNGVVELTACFSKADLRTLFSGLPKGTSTVAVTLSGDLSTGGGFRTPLVIDVVSSGKPLAALLSPNPLRPETTLEFTTSTPGRVEVSAYGVDGRLVRTLLEGDLEVGRHELRVDGPTGAGTQLASGVYFYRIVAPEGVATGQFTVMR